MFLQAEMMVSIPKTNQDVFGKVEVVIVRHGILYIYMIPLPNKAILAFAVRADAKYDYKKLLDNVFKLIRGTNFDHGWLLARILDAKDGKRAFGRK
jgi:hypothetical protein